MSAWELFDFDSENPSYFISHFHVIWLLWASDLHGCEAQTFIQPLIHSQIPLETPIFRKSFPKSIKLSHRKILAASVLCMPKGKILCNLKNTFLCMVLLWNLLAVHHGNEPFVPRIIYAWIITLLWRNCNWWKQDKMLRMLEGPIHVWILLSW